jgi:hypothetical protein
LQANESRISGKKWILNLIPSCFRGANSGAWSQATDSAPPERLDFISSLRELHPKILPLRAGLMTIPAYLYLEDSSDNRRSVYLALGVIYDHAGHPKLSLKKPNWPSRNGAPG